MVEAAAVVAAPGASRESAADWRGRKSILAPDACWRRP
jgi:hypothetical protein